MNFVCPTKSSIETTIAVKAFVWKQLEQVVRHLPCLAQIAEIETSEEEGACATVAVRLVTLQGNRALLRILRWVARFMATDGVMTRDSWVQFVAANRAWAKKSAPRRRAMGLLCRAVFASKAIEMPDVDPPHLPDSARPVTEDRPQERPLGYWIRAMAA